MIDRCTEEKKVKGSFCFFEFFWRIFSALYGQKKLPLKIAAAVEKR